MIPETFTDGIGRIGLSEGMVRIELVTLSPTAENDDRRPEPEIRHRIIMTPQAFLRSCAAQQRFIEKLRDASLVRGPPERVEPEKSSDNGTGAGDILRPPRSPNFDTD